MKGKKTEKKKTGSEVVNFSALCESRYAKMRCGGCRVRWYCSKECQVLHWKRGGHKQECQALLQSAAEEAQGHRLANTTNIAGEKSERRADKAEIVTCAICLESPERPMTLPCSHEFCRTCIEALRVTRKKHARGRIC